MCVPQESDRQAYGLQPCTNANRRDHPQQP